MVHGQTMTATHGNHLGATVQGINGTDGIPNPRHPMSPIFPDPTGAEWARPLVVWKLSDLVQFLS